MSNSKKYYQHYRNYRKANNPQNEPLTFDETKNLMTFVDNYYKAWGEYNGVYTPYLTNQKLGKINLSTKQMDGEALQQAFKDPLNHQNELIGYSEYLKLKNAVAKRTLSYMGNLAVFDMSFSCNNITDASEYESEEYKADLARFREICARFDYKGEFSKILKRILVNDTYYSMFRTDTYRYGFQELPFKYCKITGRNLDWGLLFDFDMNWFLEPGLSIDQYPDAMKRMYSNVFRSENIDKYNPANKLNKRDGTWSLWTQTSPLPEDGGFTAFKFNDDIYANVPFLTSLFEDAINADIIRQLQNNQYIIASEKLLVGLIPLLKDPKSGQTKDMLAISPETMGKFLGVLQQGLKQIQVKGVPFSDVKEVTYEMPNKSIYTEYLDNLGGASGVTAPFVNTISAHTATEIKYNAMIDSSIVSACYSQFNVWFSTFVNHYTKKYKFDIKFKGTIFDRQERLDNALKLADKGMVDFNELANGLNGDDIFTFENKITACSYSKIWDKLKMLPNVNTMSAGSSGSSGRPTTDTPADSTDRKIDRDIEGGNI